MRHAEETIEYLQPEEIVNRYYEALKSGNIDKVKSLMTKESYFMALDSLGLKLAFKDTTFKHSLEAIEDDENALRYVEEALSKDLPSRHLSSEINIENSEPNGTQRVTVNYTEDGKAKKLYFSKEDDGWKINYYAGRKVD